MLKVLSARANIEAEPTRMLRAVLTRPLWRAVRLPLSDDVPARCWIVPGRATPVNGRPVDVLGRDEAVRCPALMAVAVRSEVPGFGAVARISVFIGSSETSRDEMLIAVAGTSCVANTKKTRAASDVSFEMNLPKKRRARTRTATIVYGCCCLVRVVVPATLVPLYLGHFMSKNKQPN